MPSEERLHPVSILFSFGRSLKAFAVPGLVGLVIAARRPGPNMDGWMMLFLIPAAVAAVVRYLSFRLRYEATELVIRSGLVFRNERHIPYARIQNLDAVQNVFHRLLRVIEVRIQTGAGAEPEATISVLPASALEEMRRRVFAHAGPAESDARSPGAALLELPLGELLLHGFLVNRGMVVIAALYGLLWEFGLMERLWNPVFGDEAAREGTVRELAGTVLSGRTVSLAQIALALGGLSAFLIVVRFISMGWAVVRLYGYRLSKVGEDLRIEFGLFTRVTATIPLRRIQSLTIRDGPLYRLFGRVSVRVETAGGRAAGQEGQTNAREWLAPLIRPAALGPLIAQVLPEHGVDDPRGRGDWQLAPPRAFRRAVKGRLFAAAILCIPAALLLGMWAFVVAAFVFPWSVYAARKYVQHLGWAADNHSIVFRSGWLWRSTTIARVSKIQAVALRESPFDRRAAMARVRVDTAGANERSHRIDIPYLPRDRAAELQLRLASQAADNAFDW
jgi:putative membrane protein